MPPKPKKEDNISADKRQPPNEEVPRKEGEAELNGKPPEESRHGAGLASDHTDRELALRESRRRRFAAAVVARRVAAAVAALPPGRAFVSAGLCCLGRPGPPSPECANRFRVMTRCRRFEMDDRESRGNARMRDAPFPGLFDWAPRKPRRRILSVRHLRRRTWGRCSALRPEVS